MALAAALVAMKGRQFSPLQPLQIYDHVHYGAVYRTEDLCCELADYFIIEGRLFQSHGRYEPVPKSERPYPNAPNGTRQALIGCQRWVEREKRDENYHGTFKIYSSQECLILKFAYGDLVDAEPCQRDRVASGSLDHIEFRI